MQSFIIYLLHCAVEGERVSPGTDTQRQPALAWEAEAADLNAEGAKFWLTHGTAWDPTGTSREAPGYCNNALVFAAPAMLAAA